MSDADSHEPRVAVVLPDDPHRDWDGRDRRIVVTLDDAQVHLIAERAAQKALQHVYEEVGRTVLRKVAWVIGVAVFALLIWLAKHDLLKE